MNNPDACGTSIDDTKKKLPVRIVGRGDVSNIIAFGIHLEERYSFWIIALPAVLTFVVLVVVGIWFFNYWRGKNPKDLSNAAVLLAIGMPILAMGISTTVPVLTFRWTRAD